VNYQRLLARLGVEALPAAAVRQALTHSSAVHELNAEAVSSNERLEYLGDAVLELAISHALFSQKPPLPEGTLTTLRAQLVCRENLFRVAQRLELGRYLILSRGERLGGGESKPAILADALEALLGVVFLHQGYDVANTVILRLFLQDLDLDSLQQPAAHQWKSLLQERVQQEGPRHIAYQVTQQGLQHEPLFTALLLVDGVKLGTGRGKSKQEAEQAAAKAALQSLEAKSG